MNRVPRIVGKPYGEAEKELNLEGWKKTPNEYSVGYGANFPFKKEDQEISVTVVDGKVIQVQPVGYAATAVDIMREMTQAEIDEPKDTINGGFERASTPAKLGYLRIKFSEGMHTAFYNMIPTRQVNAEEWMRVNEQAEERIKRFLESKGIRVTE